MTDNRTILKELLSRLKDLEDGGSFKIGNLGFTVFCPYNGELVEREDRRLSGELEIGLSNRRKSWFNYDVSSKGTRYFLCSREDWQLSEADPDPLSIEPFLRIPLRNVFPKGSEARIYVPISEKRVALN